MLVRNSVVGQHFGGDHSKSNPTTEEPEAASVGWENSDDRIGDNLGWQWFEDLRLDCLGFTGIIPPMTIPPLVESDKETNEENYLLWRVERGIVEGLTEIPKEFLGGVGMTIIKGEDQCACGISSAVQCVCGAQQTRIYDCTWVF